MAEAEAYYKFALNYGGTCRSEIVNDFDVTNSFLTAQITAGRTLNGALWSAAGTANSANITAIQNNDSTSDLLAYLESSTSRNIDLETNLTEALGDYQIAWRQDRLGGMTSGDANYDQYADDLSWATKIDAARNSYYALMGNKTKDFNETFYGALSDYADSALAASIFVAQDKSSAY